MISIHDDPIRYMLDFENDLLFLNQFIGKNINLKKIGYCCLSCSENIQIFANGFCKKCFFESPMSGDWVMKPELSKAHLEIEDRDLEYEKQIQIQCKKAKNKMTVKFTTEHTIELPKEKHKIADCFAGLTSD